MSIKIHELARELDIPSKDVLAKAAAMGIDSKSHMSAISDIDALTIKNAITHEGKAEETKIVKVAPKADTPKSKPSPEDAPRVVVKAAARPPAAQAQRPRPPGPAPERVPRAPVVESRLAPKPPQGVPRRVVDAAAVGTTRIPAEKAAEAREADSVQAPEGIPGAADAAAAKPAAAKPAADSAGAPARKADMPPAPDGGAPDLKAGADSPAAPALPSEAREASAEVSAPAAAPAAPPTGQIGEGDTKRSEAAQGGLPGAQGASQPASAPAQARPADSRPARPADGRPARPTDG
ncbi:MAG: translation initiation factor IF-2 N-terminal domain-containing protein, partial [Clostridiales Family XIII bacterium]|nr:translation initiation factor IF-2 N-terminal domain-containing protein [Clostridiales Family XIII bacterium]